jgi:hypothetical protein
MHTAKILNCINSPVIILIKKIKKLLGYIYSSDTSEKLWVLFFSGPLKGLSYEIDFENVDKN